MIKVYSSANLAMVHHLKNVLEMHDIACEIRGESRLIAAGELPPIECWTELWVLDESQIEQARQIINEAIEPAEKSSAQWICPICHETLEGQFTECWKCGTSRPSPERAERPGSPVKKDMA